MALIINGVTHVDGAPLTVQGIQAQSVTVNGVEAWRNSETVTLPQFAVVTNIGNWLQIESPGTHPIKIVNNRTQPRLIMSNFLGRDVIFTNNGEIQGEVAGANGMDIYESFTLINNGWIRGAGGNGGKGGLGGIGGNGGAGGKGGKGADVVSVNDSEIFYADDVWVVPAGVTTATLCMIGGGGSGGMATSTTYITQAGGGYSGNMYNNSVAVTPNSSIAIVCGAGGVGRSSDAGTGNTGQQSSFGGYVALGGAGGNQTYMGEAPVYESTEVARSTCFGSFYDGNHSVVGNAIINGGQAGFATGGNSNGGVGANGSGGAGSSNGVTSGAGGRGVVKVSWTVPASIGGAGGEGGNGSTTLGAGGIGGTGGNGISFAGVNTIGGAGGTGGSGGTGSTGIVGNGSNPAGGYSGGTGGTGGTRGSGGDGGDGGWGQIWGVAGEPGTSGDTGWTGLVGFTGSQGAGNGTAGLVGTAGLGGASGGVGLAGGAAGNAIIGSSFLTDSSVIGDVSGVVASNVL